MKHKAFFEKLSQLYTELARANNLISLRLRQYSEYKIDVKKFEADFIAENQNIGRISRAITDHLQVFAASASRRKE